MVWMGVDALFALHDFCANHVHQCEQISESQHERVRDENGTAAPKGYLFRIVQPTGTTGKGRHSIRAWPLVRRKISPTN